MDKKLDQNDPNASGERKDLVPEPTPQRELEIEKRGNKWMTVRSKGRQIVAEFDTEEEAKKALEKSIADKPATDRQ